MPEILVDPPPPSCRDGVSVIAKPLPDPLADGRALPSTADIGSWFVRVKAAPCRNLLSAGSVPVRPPSWQLIEARRPDEIARLKAAGATTQREAVGRIQRAHC
jgi:hypothetical protein